MATPSHAASLVPAVREVVVAPQAHRRVFTSLNMFGTELNYHEVCLSWRNSALGEAFLTRLPRDAQRPPFPSPAPRTHPPIRPSRSQPFNVLRLPLSPLLPPKCPAPCQSQSHQLFPFLGGWPHWPLKGKLKIGSRAPRCCWGPRGAASQSPGCIKPQRPCPWDVIFLRTEAASQAPEMPPPRACPRPSPLPRASAPAAIAGSSRAAPGPHAGPWRPCP